MKIALIQAPVWGISAPPLALASLSAYLRRRGHEVLVLDLNIELYKRRTKENADIWQAVAAVNPNCNSGIPAGFAEDNKDYLQEQADRILAGGAKVVGFSIHQSSTAVSLYLAKLLKRKNKKIIIVFGGIEARKNAADSTLFGDENVDFFVQGEGELTLTDIVENKKAGDFCKGALIRRNGKLIDCGDRDLIKDLDSLPIPDFSDYDLNDYAGPGSRSPSAGAAVITAFFAPSAFIGEGSGPGPPGISTASWYSR